VTGAVNADFPNVAVASNGVIHIGYLSLTGNATGTVTDAAFASSSWTLNSTGLTGNENIDGSGPFIALDSHNLPAIVCNTGSGELTYTHYDGTQWNSETVSNNVFDYSNLAFTPGDIPGVALLSTRPNGVTAVSFADRTDGRWKEQKIGSASGFTSFPRLVLDNLGVPFGGLQAAMGEVAVYAFLAEPAVSLSSLQVTSSVKNGHTFLTGGLKLTNQGTGASGQFKLNYFLSATAQLDSSAMLLGSSVETSPGVNHERSVKFKLSSPASPSGMYLIAQLVPAHASEDAIAANGGILAAQIP
jgi:hypothetical protein